MRTFSCVTTDASHPEASEAFILADDEQRARELARREFLPTDHAATVEIREGGRLISIERSAAEAG